MEVIYQNLGLGNVEALLLIIPAMFILYYYIKKGGMNRKKWLFLFTRFVIMSLIIVAIASPFIAKMEHEFKDIISIVILFDKSKSMEVFGNLNESIYEFYSEIKSAIKNLTGYDSVELKYFSQENRTTLGDALYRESIGERKDNDLIILVSDGNNNYGKSIRALGKILSDSNITVSALLPEIKENEIYIRSVEGEKKIPANSDYKIKIIIDKIGNETARYKLELRLDGKLLHSSIENQKEAEREIYFTFTIKNEGIHKISVSITPETPDHFHENNMFIKSIDVVEKPDLLFMSNEEDSPLRSVLENSYDLKIVDDLRYKDFYSYDCIIIDNQPASKFGSSVVDSLYNYIINGNGIVVIGGDHAYEKGNYYNSQFEALLPVISTEPPERKRKEMAIIFLIDISESASSVIEEEKATVINLIEQFDDSDLVCVIAFNKMSYLISPPALLGDKKTDIIYTIKRLKPSGGTDIHTALLSTDRILDEVLYNFSGEKNVILIFDGDISTTDFIYTKSVVEKMKEKGINLYIVGVGPHVIRYYVPEIAVAGGGRYFETQESERLKSEFEEKKKEEKEQYILEIYDKYHFITRNLKTPFYPGIKDYNGVTEKSIARTLITTRDRMPILVVWRFGLGRVASLTIDNGLRWAPNIYMERYNDLILRTVNWVISNLEKRKRVNIETNDIFSGEKAEIRIKSEKRPSLFIEDPKGNEFEIKLKQIDLDIYSGDVRLDEGGFYILMASSPLGDDTDAIAVNYPREFNELGINLDNLRDIVVPTNGKLYNYSDMSELKMDVLEYVRRGSFIVVMQRTPLHIYFIIIALSLFFIDVITRRILEIIRLRRGR
ncbi:MAG: hypothetical protein DRO95_05470 [Candidatus Altiarchaeales archaeon]|nr:MAG: hypothetical protein DRO95_05470 [Candidatus Altiarchaeales archaeon]